MTEAEYRMQLKKELCNFRCVEKILIRSYDNTLSIFKSDDIMDKEAFVECLKNNKNKFKVLEESENYIIVQMLGVEKYKAPKTELDLEIENLEKELKKLKELRKKEKEKQIKKDKILRLKEELKKLEEES